MHIAHMALFGVCHCLVVINLNVFLHNNPVIFSKMMRGRSVMMNQTGPVVSKGLC